MDASRAIVGPSPLAANQVWLWGQGGRPRLPSFADLHGLEAGLVTAVDLVRGLGVLADIEVIEVEGATGWFDTNYEGKREAALDALGDGADLFVIHVEATDEAGHAGNVEEKVRALENWDRRILADLVDGLDSIGPWRLLLLPDHATPLRLKTHTSDPVPYLLYDRQVAQQGGTYSEAGVADRPVVPGHELLGRLVSVRVAPPPPAARRRPAGRHSKGVSTAWYAVRTDPRAPSATRPGRRRGDHRPRGGACGTRSSGFRRLPFGECTRSVPARAVPPRMGLKEGS